MPFYLYKARTRDGRLVVDTVEGENLQAVISRLQRNGYYPISVVEKSAHAQVKERAKERGGRVRLSQVAIFTRQLADLLNAGLPLARALAILEGQTDNPAMKAIIASLREDVEGGSSFADALRRYEGVFPALYIGMVRVGEASGLLVEVLRRLAKLLEQDLELRSTLLVAAAYPAFIAIAGVGTVIFFLSVVVPNFITIFEDMQGTLPLPTILLLKISSLFRGIKGLILLLIAGSAIAAVIKYFRTPDGRKSLDRLKLRLPLVRKVVERVLVARFTRTLGTLLSQGVDIIAAIDMASAMVGNTVLEDELTRVREQVRDGRTLARPLAESPLFPRAVVDLVAVGEEAGNLPETLMRIADIYERELDSYIKVATSLLSPVLILLVAGLVAFIAAAVLLPILQMTSAIKI